MDIKSISARNEKIYLTLDIMIPLSGNTISAVHTLAIYSKVNAVMETYSNLVSHHETVLGTLSKVEIMTLIMLIMIRAIINKSNILLGI